MTRSTTRDPESKLIAPWDENCTHSGTCPMERQKPANAIMPDESRPTARTSAFRSMGRALSHRNFRLFFVGQTVSMIGGWMTRVATGWLVFRLSGPDSAFLLGVVGFAGQ